MGAATGAPTGNQVLLPSINDTDMSIQADPRVMRMTVGAIPNSSSAHAQVRGGGGCFSSRGGGGGVTHVLHASVVGSLARGRWGGYS